MCGGLRAKPRAHTHTKFTPRRNVQGEASLILGLPRRRGALGFERSTELSGSFGPYGLLMCDACGVEVAAGIVVHR